MPESINWIHFSDLHFGLDQQGWLWPTVKHNLLRDLEVLSDRVSGWDLVFFTGDLVQSGESKEFQALTEELQQIWKVLEKRGTTPQLCVIPGNHDLQRPASESALAKALVHVWPTDKELQRNFWANEGSEYRAAVNQFFVNYSSWAASNPVPMLPVSVGTLPGDFSAIYQKGDIQLGIIGLNSTFLQIAKGDFQGKLDIHISQLNAVCSGDPQRWVSDRTATVLLSHHPPSWLSTPSLQHYRQEIYPSGRFIAHFCGHQHNPEHLDVSEAGAAPRRLRQAPSLFGLESWEGLVPEKRTHGYNAGQFVFEATDGFLKLWPKIGVKGRDGGINIAPDYSYRLKEECVITPFEYDKEPISTAFLPDQKRLPEASPELAADDLSLLDAEPTESLARSRLSSSYRFSHTAAPHYRATRQDEQSEFEHHLRKSRSVWLAADWGTGQEGFLAAAFERLMDLGTVPDIFLLRCDDATDVTALEAQFPQQIGFPLQLFCNYVAALPRSILILDAVHPSLSVGEGLVGLRRIANAITEYCPNLLLVVTSKFLPEQDVFATVQLRPLEVPEVRTYLMQHPDATPETRDPDLIETLHERSDGLPMHIDRLIKAMRVASPEAVLEADRERSVTAQNLQEPTPKALVQAVETLLASEDRPSTRSLKLLQVLSLLPYGETLETLRHYLATEPFFPENAVQLQELALIDVIPLQQTTPRLGSRDLRSTEAAPKLLKVPRQVRDYLLERLSDEQKDEILRAGIERFFGRGWRHNKVRLRKLPIEQREFLNSGPGNEFALIHQYMALQRAKGDMGTVLKVASLGIQYSQHLQQAERYHDLALVGGALLHLLDQEQQAAEWTRLASLYGFGLRMTGKAEESLTYLRAAMDRDNTQFNDEEKAEIWYEIALAAEKGKDIPNAVSAAEKAKEYSKKDSPIELQASALIANLTLTDATREQTLSTIEARARSKGQSTVANTIALLLFLATNDPQEELRHLNRILKTEPSGYNRVRALVSKANTLGQLGRLNQVTGAELAELARAYTYLHSQRFGILFDQCHEALWDIFESEGDTQRLLKLFRHSSFLWRIRGREEKESGYLKRLSERNLQDEPSARTVIVEFSYFMRRLKIILHFSD